MFSVLYGMIGPFWRYEVVVESDSDIIPWPGAEPYTVRGLVMPR